MITTDILFFITILIVLIVIYYFLGKLLLYKYLMKNNMIKTKIDKYLLCTIGGFGIFLSLMLILTTTLGIILSLL